MRIAGASPRHPLGAMRKRLVRWVRRYVNSHCVHIAAYHSVAPSDGPFTRSLPLRHTPAEFEAQMAYLRRHYRPTSLRRVVEALEQDRPLDRAVVVTFDDGFRDVLTYALPILRHYQIPATMFLVTSVVDNIDLIWRHKLAWLVSNGHSKRAVDALQAAFQHCGIEVPVDRFRRGTEATPDLFELTRRFFRADVVTPVLDGLLADAGRSGAALADEYRPYVALSDLKNNDDAWLDFGNHTHTHPMLSALSPPQQERELAMAHDLITRWTGRPPLAAAFPFGLRDSYNPVTIAAVRETGHRAALDLRRRVNVGAVSPFNLSRFPAPRDSAAFEHAVEDSWNAPPQAATLQADEAVIPQEAMLLCRRMFRGVPRPIRLNPAWRGSNDELQTAAGEPPSPRHPRTADGVGTAGAPTT